MLSCLGGCPSRKCVLQNVLCLLIFLENLRHLYIGTSKSNWSVSHKPDTRDDSPKDDHDQFKTTIALELAARDIVVTRMRCEQLSLRICQEKFQSNKM